MPRRGQLNRTRWQVCKIVFVNLGVQFCVRTGIGQSLENVESLVGTDLGAALVLCARPRQTLGVWAARHQLQPELVNVAHDLKGKFRVLCLFVKSNRVGRIACNISSCEIHKFTCSSIEQVLLPFMVATLNFFLLNSYLVASCRSWTTPRWPGRGHFNEFEMQNI